MTAALRLLHVEDNPADALLMQEYIRESCRRWNLSLPNGSTASESEQSSVEFDSAQRLADVTKARASRADCAILDLSLPDASVLHALVAMRTLSRDLPIVVLTGFDDLEVGLTALRCGADDYLVKSQVDGFTLDRAVRYAIVRRKLASDQAAAEAAATVAVVANLLSRLSPREQRPGPAGESSTSPDDESPGTGQELEGHRVTVQIDLNRREYVLSCVSCGWRAERGSAALHSWSERSLDAELLQHITFGNEPVGDVHLPLVEAVGP
jgi:DNA-binding NarL/FixJ family response regulator